MPRPPRPIPTSRRCWPSFRRNLDRGRAAVRHQVHRRAGREDPRRGLLAQVGVDAAGIGAIVDALAGIGITQDAETLDAVRQGIGLMGAYKTVERKLGDRSFLHCGSSCSTGASAMRGLC
jgi:hypothetical protein